MPLSPIDVNNYKILTDAGKQNADVEVSFYGGSGGFFGMYDWRKEPHHRG